MSTRTELLLEAKELGLTFKGNISSIKLQELVDTANAEGVIRIPEPQPITMKEEVVEPKQSTSKSKSSRIAEAKSKAFALKIVTISSKDKRDNEEVSEVFLSCKNQHFGKARMVPLDIPVELEVCLIGVAKDTMMTIHKEETIGGKRTGNKVAVSVPKFAISYEEVQ